MKSLVRRGLRLAVGLTLGACSALAELLFALLAGLALLLVQAWPRARSAVLRPVHRLARGLAEWERKRLAAYLGAESSAAYTPGRALRYLAARWPLGLLGAVCLVCVLIGAAYGGYLFLGWFVGDVNSPGTVLFSGLAGLFLLFLSLQGMLAVGELEKKLARHHLGPSEQEELQRRIEELAVSRAGVVEAVHDERRRIERDLHDGVQQRLVALGMLLGRALRGQDPERREELLRQAHEESRLALGELRDVAWRVYPVALDEAGLAAALESVVERTSIPVRLDYGLPAEPDRPVATVAYFVVSEAVTNAVKHSQATAISVRLAQASGRLLVTVGDDGIGGADPAGGGLVGLRRRTAALDGTLDVHSPPGGPTLITAELPCA
ncbi:sensor histidine kinase [Streptomyces sp. TRM66268-LWL]|uniref:histidine kinase n=1 Tax=Streptomyces polyasparticus TaxID=2767826 RepID=A0ABR7SE05_9ACTN|nr:sensor histidine kinase [Streptomyces polyasparticus]MBC9712573.1 sensor histidine kinase [Streptomyces polyasparticus]